ncbi:trehalose-phosphatase [Frigidibacter sp. SD6-1]|uniref:trehalose-phosphatase n=1 Tax=Frigidibacter sp. SD6-1 TaxID=3032581 RepID=UPI0024E03E8E|nr:trehalose-phosphatase [Frigidibacter sp. SD6-1]
MLKPPVPDPGNSALFLDIDGTLVEHAAHPDAVRVHDDLPDLLTGLKRSLGGAVAFVTGRDLKMVTRLFGDLGLPAAGVFGVERMLGRELETQSEEALRVAPVFQALERDCATLAGVFFEHKGAVLAIHTRAAPETLSEVTALARAALKSLPQGYRLIAGHAGVELLPEAATKSAAIAWFMTRPPFRGRMPVFLGDDTSDESGFDWVNRNGGLSVRVRPEGPTEARHALASVDAVHDWLRRLACAEGSPARAGPALRRRTMPV